MKKNSKLGTWVTTFNPDFLEVLSSTGFGWIAIDMEHSCISIKEFYILVGISKKLKLETFVRLDKSDHILIKKSLDSGVDGIIFSLVNTVSDVEKIRDLSLYSPAGNRGVALARPQLSGLKFQEYLNSSNKKLKIILQIESKSGIDYLDKILKLRNIFGVILGSYDLSSSLGKIGNFKSKDFKNYKNKFLNISKKHKTKIGIHLADYNLKLDHKNFSKYDFYAIGTDNLIQIKECQRIRKIIRN